MHHRRPPQPAEPAPSSVAVSGSQRGLEKVSVRLPTAHGQGDAQVDDVVDAPAGPLERELEEAAVLATDQQTCIERMGGVEDPDRAGAVRANDEPQHQASASVEEVGAVEDLALP